MNLISIEILKFNKAIQIFVVGIVVSIFRLVVGRVNVMVGLLVIVILVVRV